MGLKKIVSRLLILFIILLTTACLGPTKDKDTENKELILATAQLTLKDYNINSKTSNSLDDWTITSMKYNDTFRWTAATYDDNNKRIKLIFEWTGNNNEDLILKYLLYAGNEYYNKLK